LRCELSDDRIPKELKERREGSGARRGLMARTVLAWGGVCVPGSVGDVEARAEEGVDH
jgi:hypothetical protein